MGQAFRLFCASVHLHEVVVMLLVAHLHGRRRCGGRFVGLVVGRIGVAVSSEES